MEYVPVTVWRFIVRQSHLFDFISNRKKRTQRTKNNKKRKKERKGNFFTRSFLC